MRHTVIPVMRHETESNDEDLHRLDAVARDSIKTASVDSSSQRSTRRVSLTPLGFKPRAGIVSAIAFAGRSCSCQDRSNNSAGEWVSAFGTNICSTIMSWSVPFPVT